MKKNIRLLAYTAIVVGIILCCFIAVHAEESTQTAFDFRNAGWGMEKVVVKATEFGEPIEDRDDLLVYSDVVGGDMDVLVAYNFSDGRLVSGKYLFLTKHPDKNDYIADYKRVKETLTLKYGSPKSDEELWHNHLYKDDTEKWGLAVSLGHLAYRSKWETKTTEVILALHEKNKEIIFGVVYSSTKAGTPKELRKEEGTTH